MGENERYVIESLAEMKALLKQALENNTDHESRIRKLEKLVWSITTAAAIGGGSVSALVSHLVGA